MTQPWASLVAIGANRIETRSWPTSFRGRFAIHAAKGFPADARALCEVPPFREALAAGGYASAEQLPTAAVVAVVQLDDVLACDRATLARIRRASAAGDLPPNEADFGDFSAGRFGFVLSRVQPLRRPIAARGMLGFWTLPSEIVRQVERELLQSKTIHFRKRLESLRP